MAVAMAAMASTRINRKGVQVDEKTNHRDSGEGRSSRAHSLPDSHHNHVVHGPRTSPTLLAEPTVKSLVRENSDKGFFNELFISPACFQWLSCFRWPTFAPPFLHLLLLASLLERRHAPTIYGVRLRCSRYALG